MGLSLFASCLLSLSLPTGSLVIVGGGSIFTEIKARFVELVGGGKAKIIVIPTGSVDADKSEKLGGFLKPWRAAATSIDAAAGSHSKRERRHPPGSSVLLAELLPVRKAA